MTAHVTRGEPRQLGEVRPNLASAQRAIETNAEGPRMLDGDVERIERLTRQRAAAAIRDRHRDHERQPHAARVECLFDPDDGGLRIERVEDGFEQQQVTAAVDQAARLFAIGCAHLVEGRGAKRRVVDVRRDRQRPIGRPDRSRDQTRLLRRACAPLVGDTARDLGTLDIDLVCQVREAVVGLRDRSRGESVGFDDVGASFVVLGVNRGDRVGLCEHHEIAVALERLAVIPEPGAAEILLAQLQALKHRPHRAIENENPFSERVVQIREHVGRGVGVSHERIFFRRSLMPLAMTTVNGSPARRDPTVTCTRDKCATRQHGTQLVVVKSQPRIAELFAHPALMMRPQLEHEHMATGTDRPAPLRRRPPRGRSRGAGPVTTPRDPQTRRPTAAFPSRHAST